MACKHHKPEEIVAKLRQVGVLTAQGKSVSEGVRAIGVTEATYYRWRSEYGGLKLDQVMRLLIDRHDGFLAESRDVLRAGLQTASWITVDDIGARHAGSDGFCTQIGNDDFAWFGTRTSKSRLNFLGLPRVGHSDYVVNDAALDYMRSRSLAGPVISSLATARASRFPDHTAWEAHLQVTPDPVGIATEGALWGAVTDHGFLREAVIVSDDAGQFNLGTHALCWVHAERLVHKLDTFTDPHGAAPEHMCSLIWWYYADLKAYRTDPNPRRRCDMRARFDRIFARRTGFATLDGLVARLHANKPVTDGAQPAGDPAAHQRLRT
jgi:hypothetical protein